MYSCYSWIYYVITFVDGSGLFLQLNLLCNNIKWCPRLKDINVAFTFEVALNILAKFYCSEHCYKCSIVYSFTDLFVLYGELFSLLTLLFLLCNFYINPCTFKWMIIICCLKHTSLFLSPGWSDGAQCYSSFPEKICDHTSV